MKKLILLISTLLVLVGSSVLADYMPDLIITGKAGIWTDSRSYSTLADAVTDIGSDHQTLYITEVETCTNLTVNANTKLKFVKNGAISTSGTLTINTRDITAEDRQIFRGTGTVDFAPGSVVRSSWFATVARAIIDTNNDSVTVVVSEPETVVSSCIVGDDVVLRWESPGNHLSITSGTTISNIKSIEAGKYLLLAGDGDYDFVSGIVLRSSWFTRLRSVDVFTDDDNVDLTIVVDKSETVDYDTSFDVYQKIEVEDGCILTISAGDTVTVYSPGHLTCGKRQQIKAGSGSLVFTTGGTVYPDWWAANVIPGTTDMGAALVEAIASLSSTYGEVFIHPVQYRSTSALNLTNRVSLKGQDPWNSRLMFALTSGNAIDIRGTDTSHRKRCVLENLRIDGSNCTGTVDGVAINWNQDSMPLIRDVTIYGGYTGASDGFRYGLEFEENGYNWIVNFDNLAIEGCTSHGVVINSTVSFDTQIINFVGCRIENNRGIGFYNRGGVQVNLYGCTIEGSGYGSSAESEVYLDFFAKMYLSGCWIEAGTTVTEAIYIGANSGPKCSLHNCHIASAPIGIKTYGFLTLSGYNYIYSTTNCIYIGANGEVYQEGPVQFEHATTKVTDAAADGSNQYVSFVDKVRPQSVSLGVGKHQNGYTFTNEGATALVAFTLPSGMAGLRYKFARVADYQVNIVKSGANTIRGSSNTLALMGNGNVEIECVYTGTGFDWRVISERPQSYANMVGNWPGVYGWKVWKTNNAGPITMTGMSGGVSGDEIVIVFGDSNTTIDFTGTTFKGNGGVDWSPTQNDHMTCIYDGTNWYCDISDNT